MDPSPEGATYPPSPEDLLRMGRAAFAPPTQPISSALEGASSPPSDAPTAEPRSEDSSAAATLAASHRPSTAEAPADLLASGVSFGRYRLLDELGRGGMGVVWRAYDTDLRRVVALKLIRSAELAGGTEIERFLREARAAARLRHANIVPVHDVGVVDGQHYFTSDFVDGESLERMRKAGAIAPRKAIAIVKTVAEALQYAHAQGIVHRDVKPANILLDKEGRPFVTDFGLAKEVGPGTSGPTLSGEVLGTPAFMSPEQAEGRIKEIGPASDQWSLGVTLYLLLTEVLPFTADGLLAMVRAILEDEPIPPSTWNKKLHPDAQTIVLRTLEKDPRRRYASLADLAADLGRFLDGEPIAARPAGRLDRWGRWARKRKAVVLPSVAALAVALASAVYAVVSHFDRVRQVEAALAETTAAKAALDKAGRVQDVLARWVGLERPLARIEEAYYDSTLPTERIEESAREPWEEVRRFMERTPKDPASQATMKALAGWARWFAGHGEEGIEWMAEARSADADLPYGAILEAMLKFTQYIERQPVPSVSFGDVGIRSGEMPPDTPAMRDLLDRMMALMDEAARARVWGRGLVREFDLALDGLRAMRADRHAEADRAFTEALDAVALRPLRGHLLLARSRARIRLGRFEGALADMEALLVLRPRHAYLHLVMGRLECQLGVVSRDPEASRARLESAVRRLDASIGLDTTQPDAFSLRGIARGNLCDIEGALADLDQAIALRPRVSSYRSSRASLRARKGDRAGALADYDLAIETDPADADPLVGRGLLRAAGGDIQGALRDYDAALALDDRCVEALHGRAMAREMEGEFQAALSDLDRAVAAEPLSGLLHHARAYARFQLGDRKGAFESEEEAMRLDPKNPDFVYGRGFFHKSTGDYRRALDDVRAALKIAPADWPIRKAAEEVRELLEQLPDK